MTTNCLAKPMDAVWMSLFLSKSHYDLHSQVLGGDGAAQIEKDVVTNTCTSSRGSSTAEEGSPAAHLDPGVPQECPHKRSVPRLTFHVLCVADDGVQGLLLLALCCLCAVHPDSRNAGGRNVVLQAPAVEQLSLQTCCSFC